MLSDSGKACQRTTLKPLGPAGRKPRPGSRLYHHLRKVTQSHLQAAKRMLESPAPNTGRSWAEGKREFSTGVEKTVENKGFL